MSNSLLKRLKSELVVNKPKPFQTYQINSIGVRLDENSPTLTPLTVAIENVGIEFAVKSQRITTFIQRYTPDFKNRVKDAQKGDFRKKDETLKQMQTEMVENLFNEEDAAMKQIGMMIDIGREVLLLEGKRGWFGNPDDSFNIQFVKTQEEEDLLNGGEGEKEFGENFIAFFIGRVSDSECLDIGLSLDEALPTDGTTPRPPAQIPIKHEQTTETGETKGVIGTAPADAVAGFPSNLRQDSPKDLREAGSQ